MMATENAVGHYQETMATFLKEADDLEDCIRIRSLAVESVASNLGTDIASVQTLRRNHDNLESELERLEQRLGWVTEMGDQLIGHCPDLEMEIIERQGQLTDAWDASWQLMANRKRLLSDSFDYQRFLADYRNLSAWINKMLAEDEYELANTDSKEIAIRQNSINHFLVFGQLLLEANHFESREIEKHLAELTKSCRRLQNYLRSAGKEL